MALTKFNYNSFDVTSAASTALGFNASANGFATISPGSMTLIKTLTASSSANLSFVHGSSDVVLDSTYPVYRFVFTNCHPANNEQQLYMSGSVNSGSNYEATEKTTSCFRAYHTEGGSSGTLAYYAAGDLANSTDAAYLSVEASNENDHGVSGTFTLFNPSSTTFVKHFISSSNAVYNDSSDFSMNFYVAGYFNTTSAINGIRFRFNTGNMDAGTIKLYGIKDS
jgi:hypothetical protein